jgi:hypothetical protein
MYSRCVMAVLIAALATNVQGQTVIHGTVRDSATHQPIAGAAVSIGSQKNSMATDARGDFTIVSTARDSETVSARAVGFRLVTRTVLLQPVDTVQLEIVLARVVNTLAPVTVSAAESERDKVVPPEYRYTHRYDKFFEDRNNNSARGRFYTRADLRGFGNSMARILRSMGVRVTEGANQTISEVYFYSCPRNSLTGGAKDGWFPTFILDGHQINLDMLSDIRPPDVEMIEVFPSAASTPADARGDGCGAIVIFTRDAG